MRTALFSAVCALLFGCALPSLGPGITPRSVAVDTGGDETSPGSLPSPASGAPETTSALLEELPHEEALSEAHPPLVASDARVPAIRYAALGGAECEAELTRRGATFTREGEARGVAYPIRLTSPLSGVVFRSMLPAAARKTSPYEVLDCRLALAMDDFARVLRQHDVVEVVHYSMWRPVSTKRPGDAPGKRHPGGLAIDAAEFRTKDGRSLTVLKDFQGTIGSPPCGPKARGAPGELRNLYCEAASEGMFNVMLSPHYNRAHKNHFHLEVTAGVKWTLVR